MGPLGILSGLVGIGEVEVLLVAALFVRGLVRVGLLKPLTCVRNGLPKLLLDGVRVEVLGVVFLHELTVGRAREPGARALVLEHHRRRNVDARRLLIALLSV